MDTLAKTPLDAAAAWYADAAGAAATRGYSVYTQATMVERKASRGQMPPLLRRDADEAYRVVEGRVTFFVDAEIVDAGPGDVVVATAGAARTFRVDSDRARWMVVTSVADLTRYLDFCRAVSGPSQTGEWPSQEELAAVTAMAAANGIELLGPPGALPDDPRHAAR